MSVCGSCSQGTGGTAHPDEETETMQMLRAAPLEEQAKINTGTPFALLLQQGIIFNAILSPVLEKNGSIVEVLALLAKQ